MLATLTKEPFDDSDWLFEVKWDGYRIIAYVKNHQVILLSRSQLNYTEKYPPVVKALSMLPDCVIDGEVIVMDEKGRPSFDLLQKYKGGKPLLFYCFDLLWLGGYDLKDAKLTARKQLLKELLGDNSIAKLSDSFESGTELFQQAIQFGLEGIVAKQRDSRYLPGERSKSWLKIPTALKQEFVIGGWTESESGRPFAALVFGWYDGEKLLYVGHAGGGYKDREMQVIKNKLEKLEIKKSPFANKVESDRKVHYIKPELVANIRFATWTLSGNIRKPAIFMGFRTDKNPKEVARELSKKDIEFSAQVPETKLVKAEQPAEPATKPQLTTSSDSHWPTLENQKVTSRETFRVGGDMVELTNVEKEIWKGVSKADLIVYYHQIAPYILPYLKDRPLSLHIKHQGVMREGLYIKDMEGRTPEYAEIYSTPRKHAKRGKRNIIEYLLCQNEATLLYTINLGCIDVNPWTSTIHNPTMPDYVVIDLDPSDNDFGKAIEAAQATKEVCDKLKLKTFPKTSGKTGIHIYIPCAGFTFPQARSIAEHLCAKIHELIPSLSTTSVSISGRGNRIYLDPNQNDFADTVAAPYCARPFHHPTVSTPLEWKEIKRDLSPLQFDIKSTIPRINRKGDLFKGIFKPAARTGNSKVLQKYFNY